MTLFTYLDIRFRILSVELQTDYSIAKEAELKAAYALIQGQRTLFKWLLMPLVFIKYILVNLRVMNPPSLPKPKEVFVAEPQSVEVDNIN